MRHRIPAFAFLIFSAAFLCSPESPSVQAQSPTNGSKPKPDPEKKEKLTWDDLKLPPGSVLILVEELKKTLDLSKKWFLLKGNVYKDLQDRLAKLERLIQARASAAHACQLTATVNGNNVDCQARFTFSTETPDSRVFLGLKGVNFTDEGSLDEDGIPILDKTGKGFEIRVMKPGIHRLTVSFTVPLRITPQMEQERSFEFGLPGAAVTTFEFHAPQSIGEIRWNGQHAKRPADGPWRLALGTADNLIVTWKHSTMITGAAPSLTATVDLTATVGKNSIRSVSTFLLRDRAEKTTEWKIQLPPKAQIEIDRMKGVRATVTAATKNRPYYLVKLDEPTPRPVSLTFTWTAPRFNKQPISLGPMRVVGAAQEGRISVRTESTIAPTTRFEYEFAKSSAVAPAPGAKASFSYHWSETDGALPLHLAVRQEKGKLETRVEHVANIFHYKNSWQIDVTTTIHGRMLQGTFDHIDVQIPQSSWNGVSGGLPAPGLSSWASLPWAHWVVPNLKSVVIAEPLELITTDPGYEMALTDGGNARLFFPSQSKTFRLTVRGKINVGPDRVQQVRLPLPVPISTLSRGAKLIANLDNDFAFARPDTAVPFLDDPHRLESSYSTPPKFVDFQWSEHRREFVVSVVSDITVENANVAIRQMIELPIPHDHQSLPGAKTVRPPMRLMGPKNLLANLARISGGRLLRDAKRESVWAELPKELFDRHQLTLEYDIPLPEADENGTVILSPPLILPEQATHVTAKTRIWTPRGVAPKLAASTQARNQWKLRRLEQVADRSALPSLVVSGSGVDLPLSIALAQPEQLRLPQIVIDRALIRVQIGENAVHHSARFRIAKVNTRFLDVQLPGPVAQTLAKVTLNGKSVHHWQIVNGEPSTMRIPLDAKLFHGRFLLQIDYDVATRQAQPRRWQTTFFAPVFRGEVFVNRLRWQLPLSYQRAFFVTSGDVRSNVDWRFHEGLWIPSGTISPAELDYWLTGTPSNASDSKQNVVLDATKLESLQVLHFSKPSWLLLCSGVILAAGLGLFFAPISRWLFWIAAASFGAAVVAAAAWWPTLTTAVVYGVQPGVAVLVVVFLSYWGWREWHRRKTVFMPGFTRTPHASSVVRNSVQSKSTVDAPRPSGVSPAGSNSS